MNATTINSFPSLHSLTSPRGWALAIIVLLHLGFFWALSNGLSHSIVKWFEPLAPQFIPETVPSVEPPPTPIVVDLRPLAFPTPQIPPNVPYDEPDSAPQQVATTPTQPNSFTDHGAVSPPQPAVVEPRIDSRRGLSEPLYPPQDIRANNEGTVLLSLYILANGSVGEVKLARSSGFPRLDDSALREAKKWRFVPGTSDGAPLAMWKQVPITFRITK
jgi:protein TonB